MIAVSACLLGINCKYNGNNNENEKVVNYLKNKKFVLICPEQLGGLSTPRNPAEIINGDGYNAINNESKIVDKNNRDVSSEFIKGANESLKIAKIYGCREAILKEGSPSCGCNFIYDGSFSGKKINGVGITTALFRKNGIKVISETEL
ncbi:DUF523 domain-containing protein [[Clostridium] dakarense]|uniref:DUF523 domain-containing protein n=1 Tax=Faecalimicrobium dakarense TaxID=1301100 RepID=UPI0004B5E1C5|nr:DUF523 domain-containing protein [[Clostridium] dakarense]